MVAADAVAGAGTCGGCDDTTSACVGDDMICTASVCVMDDSLSGGAIAAIIICSILGVVGIAAGIWYCMKKKDGEAGQMLLNQ